MRYEAQPVGGAVGVQVDHFRAIKLVLENIQK